MSWVDFGTLGLLFGMMLIVGQVGDLTWEGRDDQKGWRDGGREIMACAIIIIYRYGSCDLMVAYLPPYLWL